MNTEKEEKKKTEEDVPAGLVLLVFIITVVCVINMCTKRNLFRSVEGVVVKSSYTVEITDDFVEVGDRDSDACTEKPHIIYGCTARAVDEEDVNRFKGYGCRRSVSVHPHIRILGRYICVYHGIK